jgi:aryl-alcohol dehydrogenase-like predicted oxidoreductase
VEDSLRRLQTDVIDLYQAHADDLSTPLDETLEAFDTLTRSGKVRYIGASQFTPQRLKESLELSQKKKRTAYSCLQPLYNLYDRESFENNFESLCRDHGLGVITYYSLASGFLSGKYSKADDFKKWPRGAKVQSQYFNDKGHQIIKNLKHVSQKLEAPLSTVALAWLLSNPVVTAPIASATTLEQLEELMKAPTLKLDSDSLKLLKGSAQ